MGDTNNFTEDAGTHVGDLDLPSSESVSDPPGDGSSMSPSAVDPLAVVGSDDVGDQVVEILGELRTRARGLKEYAEQLIGQVEGMRELVLSLSSEGLARRELEERLAVLEAERDVLARQLGKVRRENEEELSIAREHIKGLETELSLSSSGSDGGVFTGDATDGEARDSSALIGEPVVETVGAAARREALKSRPSRAPADSAAHPPSSEEDQQTPVPGQPEAEAEAIDSSRGNEGESFAGLLGDSEDEELEQSFAGLIDDAPPPPPPGEENGSGEAGTSEGELPSLPDGVLELEGGGDDLEAEPEGSSMPAGQDAGSHDIKTSAPSVTLALEDLLSTYLDDKQ